MRHGQAQNEREARWARDVLQEMPCMGMQRSMWKGCCRFTLLLYVGRCFAGVPKPKLLPGARQLGSQRSTSIDVRHGGRRCASRWWTCGAINNPRTNAWPTGLRSRWCLPLFPPCWPRPWKLRQDSRCRLTWPHRGLARWSRRAMQKALDHTAAVRWSEEQLLELAASLPAMRTIRHQPRGLRQRTCTTLKKLLHHHHTHCHHHQWIKRRDSESLQAEAAVARWAWLGPTLLVWAYEGNEHADDEGLTLGQRRKLSIELAGKRATSAERRVD